MSHMFVNRPRRLHLKNPEAEPHIHFRWETVNALLYLLGGLIFAAGSLFFYPELEAYRGVGAWGFFGGSLVYLVVTLHDLGEVIRNRNDYGRPGWNELLDLVAAISYVVGTILFAVGSLYFVPWLENMTVGGWCFIVGSLAFVLGACINVVEIVRARSRMTMQLMNLTAVCFVVGSVMFTVASVPYLWIPEKDQTELFAYLASQYLVGSILFFVGGILNFWRARWLVRHETPRIGSAHSD